MSIEAIILMILILGGVWGGFVFALITAMKRETEKSDV